MSRASASAYGGGDHDIDIDEEVEEEEAKMDRVSKKSAVVAKAVEITGRVDALRAMSPRTLDEGANS